MSPTTSSSHLGHSDKQMQFGTEGPDKSGRESTLSTVQVDISAEKGPSKLILEPQEDPKHLPVYRKWVAVLVICSAALCVTCSSSIASFAEVGESEAFHVSREVTILGISLFVMGLGVGPLFLGPMSEFFGRNPVYWASYGLFWVFTWPVAFAPNAAVYLIFRFITGMSGSAFLSVAGGSVSDLFTNEHVATPMAVYTLSPFIGPVVGPLLSGFINQNVNWRWTYRVMLCWEFAEMLALVSLVPETYEPILLKRKAQKLRRESPENEGVYAPIETNQKGLLKAVLVSCYKPFGKSLTRCEFVLSEAIPTELLLYERMALFLDIWSALVLGILYLTFQAYPVIFERVHGFNVQSTGLSFIGTGLGLMSSLAFQPLWNRIYKKEALKHNGTPPPEIRLITGMPGGILVAAGLFWVAFTTFKSIHWIVPIIASVPFGLGVAWVFISTFTYLVTAYRPIAASAMAGNSAVRSSFAAGFPLFAPAMYSRLGTVGATALLAGLLTLMAPIPFIFYKYGPRIRAKSRFAVA